MSNFILEAIDLSKSYQEGSIHTHVLQGVNLSIKPREKVAIVGSSGSGKSTLLHLLGGLDAPSKGEVLLQERSLSKLTQNERGKLRNQYLGFVYQFHHLLPEFSALDNTILPLMLKGVPAHEAARLAEQMLEKVGLKHRLSHRPSMLSGGERQRVAIARALVARPLCVLADEPTGNLDQDTAKDVFNLMLELNEKEGAALVIVTHDVTLAAKMDRTLQLKSGAL
ncbi:MAG: lipoprotein-releasing ABC transporter ATP-binding protein LolD [Gammaproteobacteria bacterium]|nr:lipoprotein-releasing ABC transporter ATP-binding protein LolD [Gammaproteobacteria bacterium]